MVRIAVLDDYQQVAGHYADWSALPGDNEVVAFPTHLTGDALVSALRTFEVVVLMRERTPFPVEVIDALPALRLIVTTGPRNAALDVGAALARGITVSGTSGNITTTVEHLWALILGLQRNIAHDDATLRSGGWQTRINRELRGATLGIVGLGNIGRLSVPIAGALGMDVIAWSPHLTPERAVAGGARHVTKQELFSAADVIAVTMVLAPSTHHLIGATELGWMKPSAVIVNVSRGGLIDTDALLGALASGSIGGAALDVFETEPLPADHPLRRAPNTLLTPHMGYVSDRQYARFFADIVEDIAAWAGGAPIRLVSPP